MASQGAVFIDFQGLSEQNRSAYLQRCFSLTADSIDSPRALKVKLFFFWFRSCWGFKPSGQTLLLDMLWMPLECGSPLCCGVHGRHSSNISSPPPPRIVIDRGKRGFAATSCNRVKFDLTAWRRGSAMMMGKQVGRAMSLPPCFFSLLCPCPVKQGLTEEAVCGVERLCANYSPGTGYSWYQFKSSQNYGKLFEGSDVFESPEEKKGPQGCAPFSP